jgi:hypothetical protein
LFQASPYEFSENFTAITLNRSRGSIFLLIIRNKSKKGKSYLEKYEDKLLIQGVSPTASSELIVLEELPEHIKESPPTTEILPSFKEFTKHLIRV